MSRYAFVWPQVLAFLPVRVEGEVCPMCDGDLLTMVVAWVGPYGPIEIERGGFCADGLCDTWVIEGPAPGRPS